MTEAWPMTSRKRRDHRLGFWRYDPAPVITMRDLPSWVRIIIPLDGGFWLVDRRNGVRVRRITMADLPKETTWNTRGKAKVEE